VFRKIILVVVSLLTSLGKNVTNTQESSITGHDTSSDLTTSRVTHVLSRGHLTTTFGD